uniref:NR LBD domain-containing protein n=1 Tax=Acrobeloides nanus TaxID=290746 RepID=A0A914EIS9_9BILA
MNAESLRDTRKNNAKLNELKSEELDSGVLKVLPCHETHKQSLNLIDFLVSMSRICNDNFDPNYEHVTLEDTIKLDKIYGRTISLEEGLQFPDRVAPRIKFRWTCERTIIKEDLTFAWYRVFVQIADFANLLPQFRQLNITDQCHLFRHNFAVMSWVYFLQETKNIDRELGYPFGNGSYVPMKIDESEYKCDKEISAFKQVKKFYSKIDSIYQPFLELDVDEKEFCIFKTLLLFQFEENLSDEGRKICHRINDSLIEALWVYQSARFSGSSYGERAKRQSKILLIVPKINHATQKESDLTLLMSVFGELNLDGIPKDLLFSTAG